MSPQLSTQSREQDAWGRVEVLFDALVELPTGDREEYLNRVDADPKEIEQVRSLLAAAAASHTLFETCFDDRPPPPATLTLPAGLRLGSYRIGEAIGSGGMGEVYRAHRDDGQFTKPVALKISRKGAALTVDQFHNERQILATLEHPGIARLLDGGITADHRPYMVMELVEGLDIVSYCDNQHAGLRNRLDLFLQVCEAVGCAHRHLVVHRDLKPRNILVTADGQVKLLDFGIAKLLGQGTPPVGSPAAQMTPNYAAPEQFEGRAPTTATDVFSLGVLLHQLLSGSLPWQLHDLPLPSALQRLHQTKPKPLDQVAAATASAPVAIRDLRGDLDAITRKALQNDPDDRYPSALALAADIRRHLANEPVQARGNARSYRVGRFFKRYRVLTMAVGIVFVTLAGGLAGTAWEARRAVQQRNLFEAEDARSKAVVDYLSALIGSGGKAGDGQPTTVRAMLERGSANLDKQFAERPEDYARIVEFLGELYANLDDEESAVPLQQAFIDSAAASSAQPSAAETRLLLAQARLREGDRKAASAVLAPAQSFWVAGGDQYRGKLARSRIIEGQIAKADGDLNHAIAIYREGLREIVGAPGAVPEDISNLQNSLSLALMQAGEFDEADALMAQVLRFRESEGRLTDSLLTAIQNQGAIALNRGDLGRAELLLRDSISKRQQSFGPSGAMAAAELNLAKVLLRENHPELALDSAHDAEPIALQFTGPESPILLGLVMAEAEADLSLGRTSVAAPLIQRSLTLASAKFGEKSPLFANGLILEARMDLLESRPSEARTLADRAAQILSQAGAAGRLQLTALQVLQADILARGG